MKVLISGHSSLIAQAIAKARLEMGDDVFMTSRGETTKFDPRITIIPFDLKNPDLSPFVTLSFDAVVLCAMTSTPGLKTFHKTPLEGETLEFLRCNIEGNIQLLQIVLPHMVKQEFGRIVYISSMIATNPMAGYSIYGAIKSAMESTIRSVAFEYGKHNITANTLRAGIIATERNKKFRDKFEDQMTKNISLKTIGTPEQIAEAIHPLLSKNCYIQGTQVEVSGGLFIPN
jgi:3-oxoacyl-[acyl-carrier protein] reductase